ncbi:MAG: hypothetical protein V4694_00215 [Pseudomonadota bacterium]
MSKTSRGTRTSQTEIADIRAYITDQTTFAEFVNSSIKSNRDDLLKTILEDENLSHYIQEIPSHNEILQSAVDRKFTQSFKILIDAGFHPSKRQSHETNFLVGACRMQSREVLESYFQAIEEKHGKELVLEILNEHDAKGKKLLTHAISGKAYKKSINFLLEIGADINRDFDINLENAKRAKHDGVLVIMGEKATSDSQRSAIKLAKEEIGKQDLNDFRIKGFIAISDICETRGVVALQRYFDWMAQETSSSELLKKFEKDFANIRSNEFDTTPLYKAIYGNAYNSLIDLLLKKGANPNDIGPKTKGALPVDALSLALEHQEYDTARLLLMSGKMDDEIVLKVAEKFLAEEHHNVLLVKAFVDGLDQALFPRLPLESRKFLLDKTIECELYGCARRILQNHNIVDMDEDFVIAREKIKKNTKKQAAATQKVSAASSTKASTAIAPKASEEAILENPAPITPTVSEEAKSETREPITSQGNNPYGNNVKIRTHQAVKRNQNSDCIIL